MNPFESVDEFEIPPATGGNANQAQSSAKSPPRLNPKPQPSQPFHARRPQVVHMDDDPEEEDQLEESSTRLYRCQTQPPARNRFAGINLANMLKRLFFDQKFFQRAAPGIVQTIKTAWTVPIASGLAGLMLIMTGTASPETVKLVTLAIAAVPPILLDLRDRNGMIHISWKTALLVAFLMPFLGAIAAPFFLNDTYWAIAYLASLIHGLSNFQRRKFFQFASIGVVGALLLSGHLNFGTGGVFRVPQTPPQQVSLK